MKEFNRLMKSIRGLFMLLIGMIGFTGFSPPDADLSQNSEPDTKVSFELENHDQGVALEIVDKIDVGFLPHQVDLVRIIDRGETLDQYSAGLTSYELTSYLLRPPLLDSHNEGPVKVEEHQDLKRATRLNIRRARDGLIQLSIS